MNVLLYTCNKTRPRKFICGYENNNRLIVGPYSVNGFSTYYIGNNEYITIYNSLLYSISQYNKELIIDVPLCKLLPSDTDIFNIEEKIRELNISDIENIMKNILILDKDKLLNDINQNDDIKEKYNEFIILNKLKLLSIIEKQKIYELSQYILSSTNCLISLNDFLKDNIKLDYKFIYNK
jgi:hypothetical protein